MPESYLYLNRIHLKARKRGNAELIFTVAWKSIGKPESPGLIPCLNVNPDVIPVLMQSLVRVDYSAFHTSLRVNPYLYTSIFHLTRRQGVNHLEACPVDISGRYRKVPFWLEIIRANYLIINYSVAIKKAEIMLKNVCLGEYWTLILHNYAETDIRNNYVGLWKTHYFREWKKLRRFRKSRFIYNQVVHLLSTIYSPSVKP